MKKIIVATVVLSITSLVALGQAAAKRTLRPGDIYRYQSLSDAQVSPDGQWIAYTVTSVDSTKDKRNTDIWMVSWDGLQTVQLTNSPDGENSPRWSPDGKYISFVSSRQGGSAQVWLLDRRGGEGIKLTDLKGSMDSYAWSPDSKKLVIAMKDAPDTAKNKPPKPYIINRYHFKQDISGYQYDTSRSHLYMFDIADKRLKQLTTGIYEEADPDWSPDGAHIAFVSNRTVEPDRNRNSDIWVIDTAMYAKPRQLTTWAGSDSDPQWSPDGKFITFVRSSTDAVYEMYDQNEVCIVSSNGGEPKVMSAIARQGCKPAALDSRWQKCSRACRG